MYHIETKKALGLSAKTFLSTVYSHGGLIPKITCLHRKLFRGKFDIIYLKRVPKSFPELLLR